MSMVDIIKKKRDGGRLSQADIKYFINGYMNGEIPDYQISALLMACYFRGMNMRETKDLTYAIRDSGKRLNFSSIQGLRVDKHSTGGVGDKTSLIVSPIVASLGVKVAKISGRGLGHTGGTIDKLESIPGFKTALGEEEFINSVNEVGVAIVGQSDEIAPADKLLYALRDVTATVDCFPLIVASIMGKKLASDDDCIVLDVKTGNGAFAKTVSDAGILAKAMVDIGKAANKKIMAVISDMSIPLGNSIGNSLEVIEAIETLKGKGPADLEELCICLAANMLYLAGKGSIPECEYMASKSIKDGSALNVLRKMIKNQGGNDKCVDDYSVFPVAKVKKLFRADVSGYIMNVDTEMYGEASRLSGAGRYTKDEIIDLSSGIVLKRKPGDYVEKDEPIAEVFASDEKKANAAIEKLRIATSIGENAPEWSPLIIDYIK